jgi:hypothetical protein
LAPWTKKQQLEQILILVMPPKKLKQVKLLSLLPMTLCLACTMPNAQRIINAVKFQAFASEKPKSKCCTCLGSLDKPASNRTNPLCPHTVLALAPWTKKQPIEQILHAIMPTKEPR